MKNSVFTLMLLMICSSAYAEEAMIQGGEEEQLRQSQKMESLGTLVGGIAHDFNNLLGGMTGNLYLAKLKAQCSPEAIEKIKNVETLSFKASDLISQLLAFARKSAVQMQEINLSDHYKETLKLLKAGISENITLKTEICGSSPKSAVNSNSIRFGFVT